MQLARCLSTVAAVAFGLGAMSPAIAQETEPQEQEQERTFSLELNNARDVSGGCRLVYIALNGTEIALDETSYEVVVFDGDGRVSQFLILEFGQLPVGKTKVVQFDLAQQPCDSISRLLINDVAECTSNGQSVDICMDALETRTRTDIEFGL